MPLTEKGSTIKSALTKEYGEKKGESILYAGKNSGRFKGIDAVGARSWTGKGGSGYEIETDAATDEMGSNLPTIPASPSGGVPASSRERGMSVSDARRVIRRINDAWPMQAKTGEPEKAPKMSATGAAPAPVKPVGDDWQEGKHPRGSAGQFGSGASQHPSNKYTGQARRDYNQKATQIKRDLRPDHEIARGYGTSVEEVSRHKASRDSLPTRDVFRRRVRDAVRAGKPLPKVLQFGTAWLGTSGGSPTWQPYDARDAARRSFKRAMRDACSCGQSAGDAIASAIDAGVDGIIDLGETGGNGVPMSGWVKSPGPPVDEDAGDTKHFFKGSAKDTFRRWIRRGATVADAVMWATKQQDPNEWWSARNGISAEGASVPKPDTKSGLAVDRIIAYRPLSSRTKDYGVKGMKEGVHKVNQSQQTSPHEVIAQHMHSSARIKRTYQATSPEHALSQATKELGNSDYYPTHAAPAKAVQRSR